MSNSVIIKCTLCPTTFATNSNMLRHMRCVHKRKFNELGEEMEVETLFCSSSRCTYSTMYKAELLKHVGKCLYVSGDRETQTYAETIRNLNDQFDSKMQSVIEEYQLKLQHANDEIHMYREKVARLEGLRSENDLLQQALAKAASQVDKLYAQLEKAQESMADLAQQAINRPPTINNQLTNQIGSVKITNYLTDHQTYVDHTDPDFVIEQAQKFFEKYMVELLNGQRALARFMVDHIIKCPESGRIILCCTDTARKRFIYMNHLNEKEEDMMAKYFLERMAGPIKEVSHSIFEHIVDRLEAQKQTTKGAFELADIDHRIQTVTTKYLEIRDFDIDDKNSDFLVELAALLRGPKEITDGKGGDSNKEIKTIEHKTDS